MTVCEPWKASCTKNRLILVAQYFHSHYSRSFLLHPRAVGSYPSMGSSSLSPQKQAQGRDNGFMVSRFEGNPCSTNPPAFQVRLWSGCYTCVCGQAVQLSPGQQMSPICSGIWEALFLEHTCARTFEKNLWVGPTCFFQRSNFDLEAQK